MIPFPLSMQIIEDNLSDKYQNIIPYKTLLINAFIFLPYYFIDTNCRTYRSI